MRNTQRSRRRAQCITQFEVVLSVLECGVTRERNRVVRVEKLFHQGRHQRVLQLGRDGAAPGGRKSESSGCDPSA